MNYHQDFILSPISNILKDAVTAAGGIGSGIETYPLCDYIMQSVFLKMTGFQEQKIKCICWEFATHDYEYRYLKFNSGVSLGECSSYDDKNKIYKEAVNQLNKQISSFDPGIMINKAEILTNTTFEITSLFSNSNLAICTQKKFDEFLLLWNGVLVSHFANDKTNLLTSVNNGICMRSIYIDHLYKHRNRCGHNTQSYQQNLPTFKTLYSEDYKYENYFLWFAILVVIDKVFIELYKKYFDALQCF